MQREYFIRGRRKSAEQIDGVRALRVAADSRTWQQRSAGAVAAMPRPEGLTIASETLEAFENARWFIVRPDEATHRALAARQALPGVEADGVLVVREGGRAAIATRRLAVQIDPALDDTAVLGVLRAAGLEPVQRLRFAPNLWEADTTVHADALEASVALHGRAGFVFAEPSFVEHIPPRLTPTDPRYGDQWQWSNTGQAGGTAGADVSAEDAWNHTRGAGIRVAVIDNGFDADHEDLAAGIVAVSGAFLDPPGPATVAFAPGAGNLSDWEHGTFCAGMVGARQNNTRGVSGAAPECELMLIECMGDQVGTQTTLARAVAYAADPSTEVPGSPADAGADILVSSLGPNVAEWELTQTLELAIEAAATNGRQGRGMAIFWAASNGENVDVSEDEVVSHADVIAVVRSTRDDLEGNAARGAEVELIAPGVDVVSTTNGDTYGTKTGTSYAAPCAAGCAALALAVNPDLTRDELRATMRDTADKIGGVVYDANGHHVDYGFGRVNAMAAVRAAALRVTIETTQLDFDDVPEGETTARSITWQCRSIEPVTFEIVAAPTAAGVQALFPGPLSLPTPGVGAGAKARMWFVWTGGAAGSITSGEVRVRCVQTGEEWTVPIRGNSIARPTTAVMLVLDQSGSMGWNAGDGRTRVQVLRDAARIFVDVLQPQNGVGIVRFDHDAYDGMPVTLAGPEVFGAGRAQAALEIAAHLANPQGATSIGDGLERGAARLAAASGYDHKATIVLTDGQETADKRIAMVAGSITDRTFAIGLGRPEDIDPAALTAVT
jgi:subtilisin family serine protease